MPKFNRWTNEEIHILIDGYENRLSVEEIYKKLDKRHSINSIYNKANNLGIVQKEKWTDEEINLIKEYYPIMTKKDFLKIMPNRTTDAIQGMAIKLNLVSGTVWKENEINYIKDNWKLVPDEVIAKYLNRTQRAVKWQREQLGLYRRDSDSKNYKTISKYLRANNSKWKNESMKSCEFKCVLTGSKDFQIHHTYSVSNILREMERNYDISFKEKFDDYTDNELKNILEIFLEVQNKYPLGECVRCDLHTLFHSLYGQYNNTTEQWMQFKKDFNNGLYNNKIA